MSMGSSGEDLSNDGPLRRDVAKGVATSTEQQQRSINLLPYISVINVDIYLRGEKDISRTSPHLRLIIPLIIV